MTSYLGSLAIVGGLILLATFGGAALYEISGALLVGLIVALLFLVVSCLSGDDIKE